jgi:tetratricopeptide (TPR) repeat protein
MTRDNVLFTLCGLLAGFIVGYFVATSGHAPAPATSAAAPSAAPSTSNGTDAPLVPTSAELASRIKDLGTASARQPENMELKVQLGNAFYDAGDWKAAADAYEKALPNKGSDPNLLTDLGSCYRNLGRFDKALEMYEKAQAVQPTHAQSLLNMALIYVFDMKDAGKAQSAFDRLKKEHPEIPRLDDLQMRISVLRAAKS